MAYTLYTLSTKASCSKPSTSNAGSQSVLNEKILGNIDPWPIKQIQVYILADMFLIHDLRSLAVKRFQSCLEGDQIIAEKYLEQVIRIIYSETASVQLRKFVAGFVQKRCKLPGMIAIIQKPSFQSLMRETEFGADLAQSFISDAFSGA